jgi:hypothetical protein
MRIDYAVLEDIASRFGPTVVRLNEFFMSWNSVMTLAYTGFSQTLLDLKRHLEAKLPLQAENPGSRWPKTTLGCLREGRSLGPGQVEKARELCTKFSGELRALPPRQLEVPVTELSLVLFRSRTLEERWLEIPIPLRGASDSPDPVPDAHVQEVRRTLEQFAPERLCDYYPRLAPEGRTLENYYRRPHIEATLVAKASWSAPVVALVDRFVWAMDSREGLDMAYAWFRPESRHLTVRALVGR